MLKLQWLNFAEFLPRAQAVSVCVTSASEQASPTSLAAGQVIKWTILPPGSKHLATCRKTYKQEAIMRDDATALRNLVRMGLGASQLQQLGMQF